MMRLVSVPLDAGLVVVFAAIGLVEARRLLSRDPDLQPENIREKARYVP